ncbi:MAG: hypothetical protein GC137_07550 [Alphaproteobacteria bacterium]|nr:hypothetical protein [Alphaproteobacteria bacterium]
MTKPLTKEALELKNIELEEELKHLLYVISHDLGKYSRHMREFTLILLEESQAKFNKEELEYAQMLLRAANLSETMTTALLEYARVNSRGEEFKPVDLSQLLKEVQQILKAQINKCRASITVGPLPTVMADRTQLARVWQELLKNALIFTTPGTKPRIIIKAKKSASGHVFTITDNGIGIDKKNHEKIFKLFTRLHVEGTYPGIGAGLALSNKILKRHGTELSVSSALGKGAKFSFSLPKHA